MKRSEAILIIKDLLYENIVIDWNEIRYDNNAISRVLEGIEKRIGMLPPNIYETVDLNKPDKDYQIGAFVWEPEDA